MPSQHPVLVALRGGEAYGRYLDRLLKEARKRGHTTASRTELADLALSTLGAQWGIVAPRRVAPVGSNQHGEAQTEPPASSTNARA